MKSVLSIVATPIGNLQDISLRAAKTLLTADVIACEDTRRTGLLLQEITKQFVGFPDEKKPKLFSFYDQVEMQKIPQILAFLQQGLSVALVSDAGTPLISDPGFKLVRACAAAGVQLEAIPGPSSVITALTLSGLPTDKFLFVGYPPHKQGHRKTFFENLQKIQEIMSTTIIFFEAPHKLLTTLEDMQEVVGDREIVICRELTKVHEEIRREKISASLAHFQKTSPKGECVIVFH